MNYNIQPLDASGDTRGPRKIKWYKENVFNYIEQFMIGNIIDVGCGNGRLNSLYPKVLNSSFLKMCIDPVCELDNKFGMPGTQFIKCHLHEISDFTRQQFETVCFMGSFMIMASQYENKINKYCADLLKPNGNLIILVDNKQQEVFNFLNDQFELIFNHHTKTLQSNIRVYKKL